MYASASWRVLFMAGAVTAVVNLYRTAPGRVHPRRRGSAAAPGPPSGSWPPLAPAARIPAHSVLVLTFVAVLIGGVVEFVPTALIRSNVPTIASVKPTHRSRSRARPVHPGGCVGASQMMRRSAPTERYGRPKPGEFVYDHPFLWGRAYRPDLHRVGGKHPTRGIRAHEGPRVTRRVVDAGYAWLYTHARYEPRGGQGHHAGRLGVPIPRDTNAGGSGPAAQAQGIAERLTRGARVSPDGNHRADRLPAAPRHRHQARPATASARHDWSERSSAAKAHRRGGAVMFGHSSAYEGRHLSDHLALLFVSPRMPAPRPDGSEAVSHALPIDDEAPSRCESLLRRSRGPET